MTANTFFTYYQPYRYIINRVPFYPCIGNHDAAESEDRDDRGQLVDNFYINERIAGEEAAGRASMDPGLFYRFRFGSDIEFICIDTSKEPEAFKGRLFRHPKHAEFLKSALPDAAASETRSPLWRIPFSHHPPFSAGPRHHNTDGMGCFHNRLLVTQL
jgi:tartrate-resistant acid phosphatase type 5